MIKIYESDDYFMHSVVILFLLINFNLEIGTVYLFMAMIDWVAYYIAFDKSVFKALPLEKSKTSRLQSLVWAMGIYVAFIFGVNFITARFSTVESNLSVFEYISSLIAQTFSATPILYGSTYLRLAVWGILIPIIESRFFFRTLFQYAAKASNLKITSAFSIPSFLISAFFGGVFALFHIVAKGITNNQSLMVTFIFGFLSVEMIIFFGQLTEAIFLHIITNTIATMQQLRVGFFEAGVVGFNTKGALILGGVLVVSWLLLFQQLPFVKSKSIGG